MNRNRRWKPHWTGALVAAAAACISAQSGTSALTAITSAFCTKATSCCAGLSQSACEAEFGAAFSRDGFDTTSQYTTDSVNKCTSEIQGLACPSSCSLTLPGDCPAHGQTITLSPDGGAGGGDDGSSSSEASGSSSGATGSDSGIGSDATAGDEAGE